mmetsp:Transcript_19115/g.57132  ORF Transcript_19115/g.57132 Transcript_19115/m.57132 type:complete len:248 (+) Transcript_19115:1979-2722(+)
MVVLLVALQIQALVHELQAHVLLRPLLLGRLPGRARALDLLVHALDLRLLVPLRVRQRSHRALELFRLLPYAVGVPLDFDMLHLVPLVDGLVRCDFGLHFPDAVVVFLQLRLVILLLLPQQVYFLVRQFDILARLLQLGLRLGLPFELALLQLHLFFPLLVLELRELHLQQHVAVLDDLVIALDLLDLVGELLDARLVLLRLQRGLLEPDLLGHQPVVELLRPREEILLVLISLDHELVQLRVLALV